MAAFVCSPMPFESPYQDVVGQASMLSSLFLLFTMLLASRLEKRQLSLKLEVEQTWWGSISRDALNALSAAGLFAGFSFQGYSGPDSLLLSVGLTVSLAGMHSVSRSALRVEGVLVFGWLFFVYWGHVAERVLGMVKQYLFH